MKICDVLNKDCVIPELKANSKETAIDELLNIFKDDKKVKDIAGVKKAVMEREKIMSTGVGNGFGIPHCKTNKVDGILAAFGKPKKPIEFDALDGKPVNLIFLLICNDNLVAPHIKLLSRISLLMNNETTRNKLSSAQTVDEIFEIFDCGGENIS
jgi:fructose-specific phosphotransferase system IIA component